MTSIKTDDPRYREVERLMIEAFPVDERRSLSLQREYVQYNQCLTCYVIESEGAFAGFITYWDFGDFGYVEHFATIPGVRNRGIGRRALKELIALAGKPIVLEVECPDDEMSRRRVNFYEREGFVMQDIEYIQPPYSPELNAVPMKLMATGALPLNAVIQTLHREVYGKK